MPEYVCPSCEGGFPASLGTDDACPWCGERMDGATDDRDHRISPRPISERLGDPVRPQRPTRGGNTKPGASLPFNPERERLDEESIVGRHFMAAEIDDDEIERAAEFVSQAAAGLTPSQATTRPAYDHGLGARAGDLE